MHRISTSCTHDLLTSDQTRPDLMKEVTLTA